MEQEVLEPIIKFESEEKPENNAEKDVNAEDIYKILTRREVRREKPPAENEIKQAILERLDSKEPIELVALWGAFKNTEKGRADLADEMTLDSVNKTVEKLKELGVETKVIIYFTDLHAISPFFGRDSSYLKKSKDYHEDIRKLASDRSIEIRPISEAIYGFSQKALKKSSEGEEGYKLYYDHDPEIQEQMLSKGRTFWEKANDEVKKEIMQAAEIYATEELIQKEGLEKLAMLYIGSRLFEKEWLEGIHKNSIFFSYGRPIHEIQPTKTMFQYSIKKGNSKPPWFIDAEKELKT